MMIYSVLLGGETENTDMCEKDVLRTSHEVVIMYGMVSCSRFELVQRAAYSAHHRLKTLALDTPIPIHSPVSSHGIFSKIRFFEYQKLVNFTPRYLSTMPSVNAFSISHNLNY